jgi:hypothetical protein
LNLLLSLPSLLPNKLRLVFEPFSIPSFIYSGSFSLPPPEAIENGEFIIYN